MAEVVEDSSRAMEMEGVAVADMDRCVVEEVELTVPKTDDPTLPVLTFRMWALGLGACILLSFVNQFFWYRQMPLNITAISAQIAVLPLGHLMARVLPTKKYLEGSRWEFSLNPGPFNVKEHVLITIFANSGAGTVYATHILSSIKLYYKRSLPFLLAFLIMATTQVINFFVCSLYYIEHANRFYLISKQILLLNLVKKFTYM